MKKTLTWETAGALKESGRTNKEISKLMGIKLPHVRHLVRRARVAKQRPAHWSDGLSNRACNCLERARVTSRDDAKEALSDGRLRPGKRPQQYGWKTHVEIHEWLGLPAPSLAMFKGLNTSNSGVSKPDVGELLGVFKIIPSDDPSCPGCGQPKRDPVSGFSVGVCCCSCWNNAVPECFRVALGAAYETQNGETAIWENRIGVILQWIKEMKEGEEDET